MAVRESYVIVLEVVDAATGEKKVWSVEGGNTAGLFRRGWTPNTLKPGDKIIVTVRPLRSGAAGGNYSNPRSADGKPIEPEAGGQRADTPWSAPGPPLLAPWFAWRAASSPRAARTSLPHRSTRTRTGAASGSASAA